MAKVSIDFTYQDMTDFFMHIATHKSSFNYYTSDGKTHEKQEAVIAYNYVEPNDPSANIVDFGIKVNNIEGVSEILKNNGVSDYTIDTTEGIIKILDFDMINQDATVDKIENIIRDLGGKYEKITRQKANSRYLDSETRQKAYKEWLQTNRTNKQNRNLRAHFEQAQKKITGDTKYLPTKETYGVSKFATNTVQKSIAFSDVASEILNNPEMYQYSRKTHDEARAEGLKLMKTAPQETIDKIMRNDSVLNPGEKAFALLMKEYYKQKGDKDSGLALVKILKESDTRGGQSVEASKLYQDDPDFIVEDFKNMLDKMYEDFKTSKDPTIMKWMKEHTNGIKLTEGEEKYLYDMADKLKRLDENSDEYKTRLALINTYIANKIKSCENMVRDLFVIKELMLMGIYIQKYIHMKLMMIQTIKKK